MRWMRWALIFGLVVGWFAAPLAAAAAPTVLAPPGHAGANQYFETIPSSGGNTAPPGSVSGSGSSNPGSQALSGLGQGRHTDKTLAKQGKTGQAAAALAAATAPTPIKGGAHIEHAKASLGRSAASGLADALSGSDQGGLGLLLPLMLATALIVFVGFGVVRLRARA